MIRSAQNYQADKVFVALCWVKLSGQSITPYDHVFIQTEYLFGIFNSDQV